SRSQSVGLSRSIDCQNTLAATSGGRFLLCRDTLGASTGGPGVTHSGFFMRFDFTALPLTGKAFSEKPMAFCEPQSVSSMWGIMELIAIETANRKARERWQAAQLQNPLKHAAANSAFWEQRIGTRNADDIKLSSLPALTRNQVREQVKSEGALIPANTMESRKHATSGSTGVPVEFFASQFNSRYNQVRSVAQYFLEGRDLSLNRVRLRPKPVSAKNGLSVTRSSPWLGILDGFIRSGT